MRAYDTFNPSIPDNAELSQNNPLPPISETTDPSQKEAKNKRKSKLGKKEKSGIQGKINVSGIKRLREILTSQTSKWITGLFFAFLGVYIGISFLSYFVTCVSDQSEINNTDIGFSESISNSGGEGGARISEFLINECFGLGSFLIVFWLVAIGLKLLTGKPRFKTVNFTIKCLVALITLSMVVGLLTIGMNSAVNWGGFHGRYVNEFIVHFLGWTGAIICCIFLISVFVIICLRDVIKWILRKKSERDERRRIAEEIRQEKLAREKELEEMRRFEDTGNLKESTPESEENRVEILEKGVVFKDEDSRLYSGLPDFDEVEYALEDSEDGTELSEIYAVDKESLQYPDEGDEEKENYTSYESGEESAESTNKQEEIKEGEETVDPMIVNVNEISQVTGKNKDRSEPYMHPYKFPPYDILNGGETKISVDATEQLENKEKIKKTLLNFGIPIVSIEATVGPTVTLYEIVPDKGIRIAKIRSLVDDIALSLAAEGIRIIAPIPGKGTVGIEVANKDKQTVSMRTIIQSAAYQEKKHILPVALGSTISNEVYITDLAKMPHLLVAGATGQGKSVGLNAIIASLLYSKSPDELKFVMIDPKMVEFSLYAKIESHYLAKIPDAEDAVITDMDKVVATLSSLCVEMDNRYQLLKDANVRTIIEYNKKIKEKQLNPLDGHRWLPYIVVIVDEFSDLIMTAGKEVEIPIARLAQKARAVGMHVIIATQRPSTNVITGIIKANFPARIAFKVSSGVDSKTILDTTGAQQLIGRGDMLISNSSPMVRVQCAFIDTPEVEKICDYIARQPYAQGAYELPEPVVTSEGNDSEPANIFGERDPLFDEVARLIVTSNTASTSSLQRRYSIGYNRAGKIMDQLEAAGIVGPSQGGKPRSVLVDAIRLEDILNNL